MSRKAVSNPTLYQLFVPDVPLQEPGKQFNNKKKEGILFSKMSREETILLSGSHQYQVD